MSNAEDLAGDPASERCRDDAAVRTLLWTAVRSRLPRRRLDEGAGRKKNILGDDKREVNPPPCMWDNGPDWAICIYADNGREPFDAKYTAM